MHSLSRLNIKFVNLFYLLLIATLLQQLRGISFAYLIFPVILSFICVYHIVLKTPLIIKDQITKYIVLLNLIYFYVYSISIPDIGLSAASTAYARVLFTAPLYFIACYVLQSWERYEKCLKIYLAIVILAALSLIYQNIFGELYWLEDIKRRGGVIRYASILGSMTVFGVAVGFAYIILPVLNIRLTYKIFFYGCLTIGMVLTLQKSAFANFALSACLILFITGFAKKNILKTILVLIVFSVPVGFIIFENFYGHLVVLKNFAGIAAESEKVWVGHNFIDNMLDRLSPEHFSNIHAVNFIIGVGFRGVGGAVGIEGEMGHNGLLDLLSMGGIPMLTVFLFILFAASFKVYKYKNLSRKKTKFLLSFFILYSINFPMFSGMLFNPALILPLFLSLGYVSNLGHSRRVHPYEGRHV